MAHLDLDIQGKAIQIGSISKASGVFLNGPTSSNYRRSVNKINTCLTLSGTAHIQNVQSVLKDNDHIDLYSEHKDGGSF